MKRTEKIFFQKKKKRGIEIGAKKTQITLILTFSLIKPLY